MMAASAPLWKTPLVCPVDPLALSPRLANPNQSQGRRGEESAESQHLIGDGLADWMTEKVDFSSYLPTSHSSPSSSLPPSPPQHDVQVPSDLEVMTSLLQEELAQLEDYFLSESTPKRAEKLEKCDKVPPAMGPQSYYQLPYASYSSSQSESSPLLVTLATGELDLLSFCGGPIGRPKTPRPVPYNCSRPNGNGRKRVCDGLKVGEGLENIWSSKGNNSGSTEPAGSYCCVEDEKAVGKGYCLGSAVKIRDCAILLKEEENYCFAEDVCSGEKMGRGYCVGAPLESPHRKEGGMLYGLKDMRQDGVELETLHGDRANEPEMMASEGCFLPPPAAVEPYHGFLGGVEEHMRAGSLESACQHGDYAFSDFLGEQGGECLSRGDGEGLQLGAAGLRPLPGLKDEPCGVKLKVELDGSPVEHGGGERKQKKRDQNKTAAHRYRQRKRAELDSLEEELHGLEGRNRELRDKAESVEREIQYVKDLLIEVYKARSQRHKQDASA
ncbi:uncharacterized protein LOC135235646 [Anguilla rostrata]|uniref:uncharacterized protein LOC135235646 n=1 Tax=Anguilla rostrata TaxID=7938 RepID=UPI0015AC2E93|nr:uncharacterized protein LOC118209749 isoform X2 [Anguilla anguilla]